MLEEECKLRENEGDMVVAIEVRGEKQCSLFF